MKRKNKNIIITISIVVIILITAFFYYNSKSMIYAEQSYAVSSGDVINSGIIQSSTSGDSCKDKDGDGYAEWCCDNSGYVICGNTDICGPSSSWCDSYLNNAAKSCNLDKSYCCNNAGSIYDYNSNRCCPDSAPYHYSVGDAGCGWGPTPTSDNYYQRLSSCKAVKDQRYNQCYVPHDGMWYGASCDSMENKCEGTNFNLCEPLGSSGDDRWIYTFKDKGPIISKCGVICLENSEKCEGLNYSICTNNQWQNQGEILGKCGKQNTCWKPIVTQSETEADLCSSFLSDKACDPSFNTEQECIDSLKFKLNYTTVIIIISIILIIVIVFLLIKRFKK